VKRHAFWFSVCAWDYCAAVARDLLRHLWLYLRAFVWRAVKRLEKDASVMRNWRRLLAAT